MGVVDPVVCSIGTTHSLHVAGLGLDLRVADRLGVRCVSVVAGVSAQTAQRVLAREEISDALVRAQVAALAGVPVAAVRIGALVGAASVCAVAAELHRFAGCPIVCDPVIAATGGDRLADDATVMALRDVLFARCTLVTPNLDEAALLTGIRIDAVDHMHTAARRLRDATGVNAVLLKGGHLADDANDAVDLLVDASGAREFRSPRIDQTLRGTGDLLAFAIAAACARGNALDAAIVQARRFVGDAIATGVAFAGTRTIR